MCKQQGCPVLSRCCCDYYDFPLAPVARSRYVKDKGRSSELFCAALQTTIVHIHLSRSLQTELGLNFCEFLLHLITTASLLVLRLAFCLVFYLIHFWLLWVRSAVPVQRTVWKDRLRCDLFCMEYDVKHCLLIHLLTYLLIYSLRLCFQFCVRPINNIQHQSSIVLHWIYIFWP